MVIFVTMLVFVIVSCIPLGNSESNQVIVQTNRQGHVTDVDLVYGKDGSTGTWQKLTGTNGIYKFQVKNPDGVYSVAAVNNMDSTAEVLLELLCQKEKAIW